MLGKTVCVMGDSSVLITSCVGQHQPPALLNGKTIKGVKTDHSLTVTKTAGCNRALTHSQNTEQARPLPPRWKTALLEYKTQE